MHTSSHNSCSSWSAYSGHAAYSGCSGHPGARGSSNSSRYCGSYSCYGASAPENNQFLPRLKTRLQCPDALREPLKKGIFLIEETAPGISKSDAYLEALLKSGCKKIVISTYSNARQKLLIQHELPELFNRLHLPHTYMALKGSSNYLCRRKLDELLAAAGRKQALLAALAGRKTFRQKYGITPEMLEQVCKLAARAEAAFMNHAPGEDVADLGELDGIIPRNINLLLNCNYDRCHECKYRKDQCFGYRAREKAMHDRNITLVVITHALFFTSLNMVRSELELYFEEMKHYWQRKGRYPGKRHALKNSLLPDFDAIVFDDAHELPQCGRLTLTDTLSWHEVRKINEELLHLLPRRQKRGVRRKFRKVAKAFKQMYRFLYTCKQRKKIKDYNHKLNQYNQYNLLDLIRTQPGRNFQQRLGAIYESLNNYQDFLKKCDKSMPGHIPGGLRNMVNFVARLMHLYNPERRNQESDLCAGFIEFKKADFSLTLIPLEIQDIFGTFLKACHLEQTRVILTSTTLSTEPWMYTCNCFEPFKNMTGIFGKYLEEIRVPWNLDEKFLHNQRLDYQTRAALYISNKFPATGSTSYNSNCQFIQKLKELFFPGRERRIIHMLRKLIDSVNGRILILAMSGRVLTNMDEAVRHEKFKQHREFLSWRDQTLPPGTLVERFCQNDRAVLLVPGHIDDLNIHLKDQTTSLVIIDRLPFPQGTPLNQARRNHYEKLPESLKPHRLLYRKLTPHTKNEDLTRKVRPLTGFEAISRTYTIINLRQGAERLIHNEGNYIVVICDPRMLSKTKEGKIITPLLKNLPPMHCYINLDLEKEENVKELLQFPKKSGNHAVSPCVTRAPRPGAGTPRPARAQPWPDPGRGRPQRTGKPEMAGCGTCLRPDCVPGQVSGVPDSSRG